MRRGWVLGSEVLSPELFDHLQAIGLTVTSASPADLPEIIAELERLKAAAWMRAASPPPGPRGATPPDENLSAPQAARRLGVSVAWLYKNAGRLPFALRIGRRLLFSARGLERWNVQRQGR